MKKKLQINKAFSGYKPGEVVLVECDESGCPLVREWRNRVRDAEIDNCVEFVTGSKSNKPAKGKSNKNEASK